MRTCRSASLVRLALPRRKSIFQAYLAAARCFSTPGSRDGAGYAHTLLLNTMAGVPVILYFAAKSQIALMAGGVALQGRGVLAVEHLVMPGF